MTEGYLGNDALLAVLWTLPHLKHPRKLRQNLLTYLVRGSYGYTRPFIPTVTGTRCLLRILWPLCCTYIVTTSSLKGRVPSSVLGPSFPYFSKVDYSGDCWDHKEASPVEFTLAKHVKLSTNMEDGNLPVKEDVGTIYVQHNGRGIINIHRVPVTVGMIPRPLCCT